MSKKQIVTALLITLCVALFINFTKTRLEFNVMVDNKVLMRAHIGWREE